MEGRVEKNNVKIIEGNTSINIEDMALKTIIYNILDKPLTEDITMEELSTLEFIDASYNDAGMRIHSLNGLQYAENLKILLLSNNVVSSLDYISGLKKIAALRADFNKKMIVKT